MTERMDLGACSVDEAAKYLDLRAVLSDRGMLCIKCKSLDLSYQ